VSEDLYQVSTSRGLCAGFVVRNEVVVTTAPVLKRLQGETLQAALNYIRNRKWKLHGPIRTGVSPADRSEPKPD
jgi:hypothetical protein